MDKIKWVANGMPKTADASLPVMSLENVKKARAFHESFPQYAETPLAKLDGMAKYLGLKKLFVKDESYRFGLNAFKVLGGSFAMANYIAEAVGKDVSECDYAYLTGEKLREEFGQATFFTATDGNHGRGVAWAANRLGQKAVVLMPKGSTKTRFDNIAKEGAKVTIEEVNYDECVRRANALAEATEHGVMVQDTAWDGYEKIPAWIMEGYGTMASEASEQLGERPTHIFVQAGVGSLAGAIQGYFANLYPDNCPTTVVMEAQVADCLYRSAAAGDGSISVCHGRPADDHGGAGLRRAEHDRLRHTEEPHELLRLLPGLGGGEGHAYARRAGEGRPAGRLGRVRCRGHGPCGHADDGPGVRRAEGGHRPRREQRGADVLHRGRYGPGELQGHRLGRQERVRHRGETPW